MDGTLGEEDRCRLSARLLTDLQELRQGTKSTVEGIDPEFRGEVALEKAKGSLVG